MSVTLENNKRTDRQLTICDLIHLDHTKVNTLFGQIKATNEPQKLEEYFAQIYQDLCVHSEAEELVVYPAVRLYYKNIQKMYDEQAEMKQVLGKIKAMNCEDTVAFKAAIERLMIAVSTHVEEEENDMFPHLQDAFGDEQQKQLVTDFKTAKSKIQDQLLAVASH
jgi:hemerythrin superfamily protein